MINENDDQFLFYKAKKCFRSSSRLHCSSFSNSFVLIMIIISCLSRWSYCAICLWRLFVMRSFMHSWECSVFYYQSFFISVSFEKSTSSSLVWASLRCLNCSSSLVARRYLNTLTINSKVFKRIIKFVSRLFAHIFFRRSSNFEHFNSVWCIIVFELRKDISKIRSSLSYEDNFSIRFCLFESERWQRSRIVSFFWIFWRTFLMSFLIIRWVIRSMIMILQISIHSVFARMRISFLIAEMNIFELTVTRINESRSDCFYSMIFLTIMSTASLSRTSTWAKIQCMWISRSQNSILRTSVCSRYWSNCFLRHCVRHIEIQLFI